MKRTALVLVLFCLALAGVASARPLQLSDVQNIVSVTEVQISPDGTQVLYLRGIANKKKDAYERQIMIVSTSGGAPRALTFAIDGLGSPRWSPDGSHIAYIANDKKKTAQVFAIARTGGAATQITHSKTDVEQFAWSPDGTQIAYVAENSGKPGTPWSVHDDGLLTTDAPQPSHIWIIGANGTGARRLTDGTWSVLEVAPPFVGAPTDPSWSPDGRSIAFTMQSDADNSDSDRTSAAVVNVENGAVHRVTGRTQYEYQAAYAPDKNVVGYLYPHGPGPISVLNVFAGSANRTMAFDRDVTDFAWLRGGRMILMAPQGAHSMLFEQSAVNAKPQALDTKGEEVAQFSVARTGAIAFIGSTATRPNEVFVRMPGGTIRKLTAENSAFTNLQYGATREITWTAADGERNDGILTYPVNYRPGKKYAFVLRIHGGPEASSNLAFNTLVQLMAARGYIVLQPNYRGSDNLGTHHEHAIYKDPGKGPGHDVIAGVRAVEALGIVDTKREAVTGHSYGGYMTGWMITHWHNWRAAVEGDAMLDWKQEYDLSAAGNLAWTRDSLGGSPFNAASAPIYASGSPITYLNDITTPTRIISGTADDTVPMTESFELYHALHDRGVPVSFIAFPGMHHGPSRPSHVEAYDRVTLQWLQTYLH